MKTLAILYICTGPYAVFWHDFYPNFKANFLPDCDRTFYVFTDAAHIDYEDAPDVRRIYQKALPWPQSTMLRFDAFLGQADALQGYDYLFFANANLHCTRVIRADELLSERAGFAFEVRDFGHFLLDPVEALTALINSALAVAHRDIPVACRKQQLDDGDGRRARAGGHDLHVLLLLAHDLKRVREARQRDDSGAVLVIVEDGNVALFLQLALDLKAAWCRDILQIDTAEAAGDVVDGLDELVDVLRLHAEGEGVNAAERLEQDALALHDGHTGLRADVAQAKDGGAVSDHGHGVPPAGQLIALVDVLLDLQAGLGHAGGIGQGQGVLAIHGGPGGHLDLTLPLIMEL